ncbi:MAG: hypothetical protein HQK61_01700 [Desulfamplus sp.]|nr:hypothetical protein [Desulfamplus sp.]
MDKSLKKILKKSDNIAEQQVLLKPSAIMDNLRNNKNCLVIMNDGAYKTSLLTNLVHKYVSSDKKIWIAFSPVTFSPFKLYGIRAGLGSESLSVKSRFEYVESNSAVTLWSVDFLRDSIDAICSSDIKTLPDVLLLENLDMLGDEYAGPCLEQVILGLPLAIPVVAFIPPVANHREILDWLMKTRDGSWGELKTVSDDRQVMAYFTPEHDLIPLLQKKKIATKVKNSLKENRPVKYPASRSFVKPLVDKLKQESLIPALIIMPSEELCDQAVQNCPKTRESVSEILSNPKITAMFNRYPVLKDRDKVVAALYSQVGALHSDNHPAWSEMIELLLSLNLIDVVFSTMYDAQAISTRVKSVVFTTSKVIVPGQTQPRDVSSIEFKRICQLADPAESKDIEGCLVFVNGEHIDVALLKDMLVIHSLSAVKSGFKCDIQAILALAGSTTRGGQNSVMMSLRAGQKKFRDTAPLVEKQCQLEELIPQARCGSSRNALKFIQKTEQFKFGIDQCNIKIDTTRKTNELSAVKKQIAMLKSALSIFPCNECTHKRDCQELNYKKIRVIFNQYNEMIHEMKQSASALEVDFADKTELLENIGLLDSGLKLTSKGKIALQSGCSAPFYLAELIWHKKDFPWAAELTMPVLAGFIEINQRVTPFSVDEFADEPLQSAYQWVDQCIDPTRKELYLNGVVIPGPSFAQSALVRALENGIRIEKASESTGMAIGAIIGLLQETRSLAVRFGF